MAFKYLSPPERNHLNVNAESPSRFINFNSHISQKKSWGNFSMRRHESPMEISKFQNYLYEDSMKIEEENLFNVPSARNYNENMDFTLMKPINKKTHNSPINQIDFDFVISDDNENGFKGKITQYMISSDFNCAFFANPEFKENFFKKLFKCKFCGALFDKGCSLGGHISRVHKEEVRSKLKEKFKRKISKFDIKQLR